MLSSIDLGDRFDAEFFEKDVLRIEQKLRSCGAKELKVYGKFVASAFYPAATHLYATGDVPFIRCVDCVSFPLITKEQNDLFERIPLEFVENQSGVNILKKGDLVITKVGTPSYSSLVYEHKLVALSRTVMGIQDIRGINKYYLLVFLRSKYGFRQLQRHRELTIQYQLTLERTKRTLVFEPSQAFQSKIESFVHNYIAGINGAKQTYVQAEEILLTEVGLKDFFPSEKKVNIKSFKNSFGISGRLDAEYYQCKYENFSTLITTTGSHSKLSDLVSIKKSIEPGSDAYTDDENGIPFLRVADYDKFNLNKPQKKLGTSFVSKNCLKLETLKPKKETILFSKDGSIGQAYCLRRDADFITSGAVLHLKIKDHTKLLSDYLTLVLNSKIVQMQAERDAGGSIIVHWRVSEIENTVIPLVDLNIQSQISSLVQESFALKAESERLLNVAKRAVEIAIEQDEESATKWIQEQTQH